MQQQMTSITGCRQLLQVALAAEETPTQTRDATTLDIFSIRSDTRITFRSHIKELARKEDEKPAVPQWQAILLDAKGYGIL